MPDRRTIWAVTYGALAVLALARTRRRAVAEQVRDHAAEAWPASLPGAERRPAGGDRSWTAMVLEAGRQWLAHKDSRAGAALAYYSVFSVGPLIVVAITIAALLFDRQAVQAQVIDSLRGLLGNGGAEAVSGMLAAADKPRQGIVATVIGLGTLLFAAVGLVIQLKDALNAIWETETAPARGVWGFLRSYVFSVAAVLGVGFLLLVSMLLSAGLAAANKYIATFLPEALLQAVAAGLSLAVVTTLFALMFRLLPDSKVAWRDVWLGALVTALLFEVGRLLIAFYIGKQGLESTYGAAASIVVLLVWVYYSAQIVLFGAEFTRVYAQRRGSMRGAVDA